MAWNEELLLHEEVARSDASILSERSMVAGHVIAAVARIDGLRQPSHVLHTSWAMDRASCQTLPAPVRDQPAGLVTAPVDTS